MKQLKITTALILICAILLSACSGGGKKETADETGQTAGDSQTTEAATGRYIETEYELPQDVKTIHRLGKLADGSLRLVAPDGIYNSADGGKTWEKSESQPDIFNELENSESSYLSKASINPNGDMFFIIMTFDLSPTYLYIDSEQNQREIQIQFSNTGDAEDSEYAPVDTIIDDVTFTGDGRLLGRDFRSKIYLIEPDTGEILQSFEDDTYDYGNNYVNVGNKLIITNQKGADIYDLSTGQLMDSEAPLNDYFSSPEDSEDDSSIHFSSEGRYGYNSLLVSYDDNTLYFCDASGLYRYTLGTSAVESVINGSLTSLSNQEYYLSDMVCQDDDTFLVTFMEASGTSKLMYYEFSDQVATIPEKELTVYSLEDNQNIRQAITKFQAENPDIYLNFETGITGEDAITVSDAITALNTRIMAGDGPDIIVLDGMPADSYTERGLLADLSDTIQEVSQENQMFENVLNTNQKENGLFAVPTRLSVPVIYGKAENLAGITDLASLSDKIVSLREENNKIDSILGLYTPEELTKLLLFTSSPAIMDTNGTLNEEVLKEFLTHVKKIYDVNMSSEAAAKEERMKSDDPYMATVMYMLSENQKLGIANMDSIETYNTMQTIIKEKDMDYQFLNTLSDHIYIPLDSVGISAKSDMIEESKTFIKALLSSEYQKANLSGGLPVNLDAYDESYRASMEALSEYALGYTITDEDGAEVDSSVLTISAVTEAEYEQFKASFLTLDTASVTNDIILDAVAQGAAECVSGDRSIEDAAASIRQNINLYLSE